MMWLWVSVGLGAPTAMVGGFGSVGDGAEAVLPGAGLAGGLGWQFGERLHAELATRVGLQTDASFDGSLFPRVRLAVGPLASPRLSVHGGVGAAVRQGALADLFQAGVGLELGPNEGWRPRLELAYGAGFGSPSRLEAALLVAWSKRAPEPVIVVEEPLPAVVAPPVPGDAAMVWVSRPTCEWLPASTALPALQSRLDAAAPFSVITALPGDVPTADGGYPPEPTEGDLVVAVLPGDLVWVNDVEVRVNPQSLVVARMEEGRATVRVMGAGRDTSAVVGVGAGATVWLLLDDEPALVHEVGFELGSSRLDPVGRKVVADLGASLGAWTIEVRGGYSPEGALAANERLAAARAEAARGELLAAGVPDERVRVLPPRAPDPERTAAQQRTTELRLIPVEAP